MLTDFAPVAKDEKSVLRRALRRRPCPQAPVAQALLATPLWQRAASVALYMSLPAEADTMPLLKDAWSSGKAVYLPRVSGPHMDFCPCASLDELVPGPYNLRQPPAGPAACRVDLLVVPALAFDRQGRRLGHGGGYYDRFLAAHPHFTPMRLGLAHSSQVLPELPADPWDISMDAICTEKGLLCS